jgi:hypothetical protein
MAGALPKAPAIRSLSAQIRYTEQRLEERRQGLRLQASALADQLRREIRQPSTLLFGAGVGFMMGELTRPPRSKARNPLAKKPEPNAKTPTPLQQALDVVTLAQTVSSAWPLVWMTRSGRPAAGSKPAPYRPAATTVPPAPVNPGPAGSVR